ncbi:NAD(P)/FAD-dependent oxidoreductase [Lacihabitans lacunae]|uniref:NAD(P)/FAD-dependent oxidoreductase n=1 Tax=Lacihabitans lacunae TaxID=1028214 RepID=A0ABV7YRQ4_9BACT
MQKHVLIIGNGIAGITTAINLRKLDSDTLITVVSEETEYFFSRTALMYVFMGHMKFEHTQPYENHFWKENKIELLKATVKSVLPNENAVVFESNEKLKYDQLVIATGSKPNKFGWPGQDLAGVSGLYHKKDLEYVNDLAPKIKKAVIVGGGLIGIELAEMLHSKGKEVVFLVRESSFWNNVLSENEAEIINKQILDHGIDLRLSAELDEIIGQSKEVAQVKTKSGELIDCQYVGLTVGVSPNIEFLKDSGIETKRGVMVNRMLQTNFENIYAIGDCAEQKEALPNRRPIEAVWYTGKIMGEALAKTLNGKPTEYAPGHWFNSAKFFDIEYQVYGDMPAVTPEGQTEFFWKNKENNKSIRILFETENRKFIGINTLGIRLRHAFFNEVLDNEQTVDYVLDNLTKANFDPEFYKRYEKEIQSAFNK